MDVDPLDAHGESPPLAMYRSGELMLTDRRVLYHGRGRARRAWTSIRLEDITTVGIVRRSFRWRLLVVPVVIVALGFSLALLAEHGGPFFVSLILAAFMLPLPLFDPRHQIIIAVPGHSLLVYVPARAIPEARAFLEQVEAARPTSTPTDALGTALVAPTTRPYQAR